MEKPALETRLEKVLAKRAGEEVDFTSETRFEAFLNGEELEPTTNLEYWINQINQNGGESGGANEVNVVFNITLPEGEEGVINNPQTNLAVMLAEFVDPVSGDFYINQGPEVTKVPLYDGKTAYCSISKTHANIEHDGNTKYCVGAGATIEGNASFSTNDVIAITGDCTINITMMLLQ